jgi:hypothetical protein
MTILRLDPALPALWRDERTLQLGAHAVVTLPDPPPWQQRVLHAMERGVAPGTLARLTAALDVPPAELEAFLVLVNAALARPQEVPRISLWAADGVDATTCTDVAEALGAAGFAATWPPTGAAVDADAVVLLAQHHVPPHLPARLMAGDVAHLPVVFDGGGATVGPLVAPGRTACLACLAAHERDRDPAWPAIAAQLVGRRPVPVPRPRAMEAGSLAARLLRDAPRADAAAQRGVRATTSVRQDAEARRSWRSHRPHPECLCRSATPASAEHRPHAGADRSRRGSATATARPVPIRETTRSTGFARPA